MGLRGQGATEYLILLAVVLIIALVGIALLGFFPGMASDAQETQSREYWSSASPLRVLEYRQICGNPCGIPGWPAYNFLVENSGVSTVTLTGVSFQVSPHSSYGGGSAGQFCLEYNRTPAGSPIPIAPGERKRITVVESYACPGPNSRVALQNIVFTYASTTEGQSITKKQFGAKDMIVRCRGSCVGVDPLGWEGCYGDC